mgnify:CR=1 FL=1
MERVREMEEGRKRGDEERERERHKRMNKFRATAELFTPRKSIQPHFSPYFFLI